MKLYPEQRWPDKKKTAGISSKEISQETVQPKPFEKELTPYEKKQQLKLAHAKKMAAKHREEEKNQNQKFRELGDQIPFGQPILVDHHSANMHRSHIKKMDNTVKKSIEHGEKAEHYEKRAKNIENPTSISSDDPEAVKKLKEKIIDLEKQKEEWKSKEGDPNADYFSNDHPRMIRMHISSLTTNIRNTKKRIEELQSQENIEAKDETVNGIKLTINKEDNRVRLIFPGKPSPEVITKLKQRGFRWSPYNKAWQRMANEQGVWSAKKILEEIKT